MRTYSPWYLSLTPFLLVASPGSAQAQEEAQVKMIYAVWPNPSAAENTLKHMNTGAKDQMEACLGHPAGHRHGSKGHPEIVVLEVK
jgi:hypothetical protein